MNAFVKAMSVTEVAYLIVEYLWDLEAMLALAEVCEGLGRSGALWNLPAISRKIETRYRDVYCASATLILIGWWDPRDREAMGNTITLVFEKLCTRCGKDGLRGEIKKVKHFSKHYDFDPVQRVRKIK